MKANEDSSEALQIYTELISNTEMVELKHQKEVYIEEAEMLASLSKRVEQLMQASPEKLMAFLYRIDVPEHKVKHAFVQPELPVAEALAREIWSKLKQSAQLRKKYG